MSESNSGSVTVLKITYDLRIRLDPDQRDAAAKLRKGDTVTVTGVLDAWGTLLPITMTHGQLAPRP